MDSEGINMKTEISDAVKYIGVDDKKIDLFENQYVVPNGISYNSYLILDDKVAITDTVDERVTDEWLNNLKEALAGRNPDYLVIHHLEPDHSGVLQSVCDMYPEMKLICSAKAKTMLPNFISVDENRVIVKGEGDTLELGSHTLSFIPAPMVHWPEVLVSYESSEKILFSADAFGKFGTLDTDEDWTCEARRYYFNIVGKYGAQVQALLKKAAGLEIKTICPLHGPILTDTIGKVLSLYNTWSSYQPEDEGVFIAWASIHGNTAKAAAKMKELLEKKGCPKVASADLSRADIAECVEDAFRYSTLLCMSSSFDAGVFAPMNDFIHHLQSKAFQNRRVAFVENGSWAPSAMKTMRAEFEKMKNITFAQNSVTIRTRLKESDMPAMEALADEISK